MTQHLFSSLHVTCTPGSERVLKSEIVRDYPDFRFSYSRPGFMSWILPADRPLCHARTPIFPDFRAVFARSASLGIGRIREKDFPASSEGEQRHLMIRGVMDICQAATVSPLFQLLNGTLATSRRTTNASRISRLHVWQRQNGDAEMTGLTPDAAALHADLYAHMTQDGQDSFPFSPGINADICDYPGRFGEICLNCMIDEGTWWLGLHRITDEHSRYPGGFIPLTLPTDAASRAWLKFEEGIRWSGFPIEAGARCVDIGSAPGGGSQALLTRGALVLGIDPAEMAPQLLNHPNFSHARAKVSQLKRKIFRKERWFLTDMNVAPNYTLDALEELVTRPDISARGLLFTLKLFQWDLAENIPDYITRIKSWGFNQVKVRHLQFNRQEVMVAALKKPFDRNS